MSELTVDLSSYAFSGKENPEEYYRFFEKEKDFKFGLQPSTLARKTLGISYAETEKFALSVYRQYSLEYSSTVQP